jgi:hypothetical protein
LFDRVVLACSDSTFGHHVLAGGHALPAGSEITQDHAGMIGVTDAASAG